MDALGADHIDAVLESCALLGDDQVDSEDNAGTDPIEEAVKVLLNGLGEDPSREGLRRTPLRVAKALREGTRGYRQTGKSVIGDALFPEVGLGCVTGHVGGTSGLVVVREIDLFSSCESCLLPFKVQCHVGYVPSGQYVVGLSKLARAADVFARRLQAPQRLAREICSSLHSNIKPAGVAVALNCWHLKCPTFENIDNLSHPSQKLMHGWIQVSVYAGSGVLEDEGSDDFAAYLALLKFKGVRMDGNVKINTSWCPLKSLVLPLSNDCSSKRFCNDKISRIGASTYCSMVAAMVSILYSLGEDPSRKELVGTPYHFLQWLTIFSRTNIETRFSSYNSLVPVNGKIDESGNSPDEIHSELNMSFWSLCEHHLLPFCGVVHVSYFKKKESVCLSRSILQSIVHSLGCKLQMQERLTRQIAETVSSHFSLCNLMVVVEASHLCMVSRGIEKVGTSTATLALMGLFSTDQRIKAAVLETISEGTTLYQQ